MAHHRGTHLDLDLDGVDRLVVSIIAGEVNVTAGPGRDTARVEVEVTKGPEADVELSGDGTLRIEHRPVRTWSGLLAGNVGARAEVTVVVPGDIDVEVRTVSADVFAGSLTSATTVTTVSGRVTVAGLDGEVALRSVSGDLEAQSTGGTVRANTVSGNVTLSGGDPTEITARAVSGDVTFDLDDVAEIDCTTVSGDVAVRLPEDAAIDLDAVTVSGRLETSFPDHALDAGRRRLRGRIGGGGPQVTARTTSGDVIVLRRASADAGHGGRGLDR